MKCGQVRMNIGFFSGEERRPGPLFVSSWPPVPPILSIRTHLGRRSQRQPESRESAAIPCPVPGRQSCDLGTSGSSLEAIMEPPRRDRDVAPKAVVIEMLDVLRQKVDSPFPFFACRPPQT